MRDENLKNKTNNSSDEIDLIELIRHIWKGRWLIVKVTGLFVVFGLLIAFLSRVEYKSEARMLPEITDTRGGTSSLLRQFGGLGGLNIPLAEGADAIRPELYPDVLKSTPFFMDLIEHNIKVYNNGELQDIGVLAYVENHMGGGVSGVIKKYTIHLPWTVLGWFKSEETESGKSRVRFFDGNIKMMNKTDYDVIKILRDRINANANQRTGVITITAEFPDPVVAAQIADFAVKYLTDYITEYRVGKVRKDLEFVKERHAEKEKEFHQAQLALAKFRDANINIISAAARTEEQRLQDQYNLAFNVYNTLAQQLEQARIKVHEETPVIQILEPVQVPVEKSKPRRALILVIAVFIGGVFGVILAFFRLHWAKFISRITT